MSLRPLWTPKSAGAEKNNALYEYIKKYREQGVAMTGGVLISTDSASEIWRYPDGTVDNIENINGWRKLELNLL